MKPINNSCMQLFKSGVQNKNIYLNYIYIWIVRNDRRVSITIVSIFMIPTPLQFFWDVDNKSLVNSPRKGQWRGALMFSLNCAWTNDWLKNRDACGLRRHRVHFDVTVMIPPHDPMVDDYTKTICVLNRFNWWLAGIMQPHVFRTTICIIVMLIDDVFDLTSFLYS